MTEPIMKYAAIMRAQIDSLNSIAQNASNSNTAGYLQESSSIKSSQFLNIITDKNQSGFLEKNYNQDLAGLRITNVGTDIGLLSNSWFSLNSDGNALITRNGRFRVSIDGYLMLGDYQIMGESGPISGLTTSDFEVRSDGSIYQNQKYVGKIKTITIGEDTQLTSIGHGIYSTDGVVVESKNTEVVQGALVGSNVSLESDMTKVIETSRHIEMLQRAMSAYDNMLDTGINKIGK